jgi:hypothetical protein
LRQLNQRRIRADARDGLRRGSSKPRPCAVPSLHRKCRAVFQPGYITHKQYSADQLFHYIYTDIKLAHTKSFSVPKMQCTGIRGQTTVSCSVASTPSRSYMYPAVSCARVHARVTPCVRAGCVAVGRSRRPWC